MGQICGYVRVHDRAGGCGGFLEVGAIVAGSLERPVSA